MFGLSVTNMSPRFDSSIHWCINTPSADSNVCSICLPLSGAICFDQPIRYGMSTSLVAIYTDRSICHRSRVDRCIGRLIGHCRSVTYILANNIFIQYILKIISYCRRCEIISFLHTQYCRMAESWPPERFTGGHFALLWPFFETVAREVVPGFCATFFSDRFLCHQRSCRLNYNMWLFTSWLLWGALHKRSDESFCGSCGKDARCDVGAAHEDRDPQSRTYSSIVIAMWKNSNSKSPYSHIYIISCIRLREPRAGAHAHCPL